MVGRVTVEELPEGIWDLRNALEADLHDDRPAGS
jgi:hypothetical protein